MPFDAVTTAAVADDLRAAVDWVLADGGAAP
jgi:hypothetical protein